MHHDGPRQPDEILRAAALKARMNVVYYERLIIRLENWDRRLRIVSALVASAGVAAAVKWFGDPWPVALGAASGAIGVISPIINLGERIKNAATVLPRYVAHTNALIRLYEDPDRKAEAVDEELRALEQTEVVEAEKVRTSDRRLLNRAQDQVCMEIGAPLNLSFGQRVQRFIWP